MFVQSALNKNDLFWDQTHTFQMLIYFLLKKRKKKKVSYYITILTMSIHFYDCILLCAKCRCNLQYKAALAWFIFYMVFSASNKNKNKKFLSIKS